MRRRDCIHLAILVLVIFATRLPFRAQTLFDWDSAQFALSVSHFDITAHQPHPPGYILIVLFLKAGTALLGEPNLAFEVINILASAGTIILLFFFSKSLWGRPTAWAACWAYLFCSVFWFHGSVASAYAIDGFWSLAIAAAAWRVLRRKTAAALVALAVIYAVGAGFRQNLAAVFFPLFTYTVWRGGKNAAARVATAGTAVLIIAAWFIPTVISAGGFAAYREASEALYGNLALKTSLFGLKTWTSFFRNALAYVSGVARSLNLLCAPLALGIIIGCRRKKSAGNYSRAAFFMLYLIPPSIVFCAIHLPKPGYLLAVLPLFFGAGARGLLRSCAWMRLRTGKIRPFSLCTTFIVMLSVFNLYLYWFQPSFHGMSREALKAAKFATSNRFSRSGIAKRDARNNGIRELGKMYAENSTLFLCAYEATRYLRHVSYYLPRHPVIEFNVSTGDFIAFGLPLGENGAEEAAHDFGKYERENLREFAQRAGEAVSVEKNYQVVPADQEIEMVSSMNVFRIPMPRGVKKIVLLTTVKRMKASRYLKRPGGWSVKYVPLPGAEELETCALIFSRDAGDEGGDG